MPGDSIPPETKKSRLTRAVEWCRQKASAAGTMVTFRALLLASLVLLFLWLPGRSLWQLAQTRLDDVPWLYDASREGLIVVDSPQIFTRERLVNQRLRDSDWINAQLDAVDDKLKAGQFGTPDTIAASKRLLEIYQATSPSSSESTPAIEVEKLHAMLRLDPLTVFEDAQMYREMLTQNRYETILDDAHDIGSNTLQRLNFRMTVSPARAMSDSLAAVTITIDEPENPEWLFNHYGRLLKKAREELENTVVRLVADRSRLFGNDRSFQGYQLNADSAEAIDRVFDEKISAFYAAADPGPHDPNVSQKSMHSYKHNLLSFAAQHRERAENEQMTRYAKSIVSDGALSIGIGKELFGVQYDAQVVQKIVEIAKASCRNSFTLWSLTTDEIKQELLSAVADKDNLSPNLKDVLQKHTFYAKAQSRSKQATTQNAPQNGGNSAMPDLKAMDIETLKAELQSAFGNLHNRIGHSQERESTETELEKEKRALWQELQVPNQPPCQMDQDKDMPRAKLLLIGALQVAENLFEKGILCAPSGTDVAARHNALTYATYRLLNLGEIKDGKYGFGARRYAVPKECPAFVDALESEVRSPLKLSGMQNIGVARLVEHELTETVSDTVARHRRLTDYFDVQIDECTLHNCRISVRTKSESFLHDPAAWLAKHPPVHNPATPDSTDLPQDKQTENENQFVIQASAAPAQDAGQVTVDKDKSNAINLTLLSDPAAIKSKAEDIGREEALRLFAELSCFSNARSYTVWPRRGERHQVVQSEQNSASFLQSITSGGGVSARTTDSAATRRHIDRVFGIGDGGHSEQSPITACDRPFFFMLNTLKPDGNFIANFLDENVWKDLPRADDEIRKWRQERICLLGVQTETAPWYEAPEMVIKTRGRQSGAADHRLYLETRCKTQAIEPTPQAANYKELREKVILHDVAAYTRLLRQRDTNISWIVAPEQKIPASPFSPYAHVARSIPLSAIVSVPSWWPSARITIRTCWLRPGSLLDEAHGADFCKPGRREIAQSSFALFDGWRKELAEKGRTKTEVTIPLPSNAQDVLPKLGFFLFRVPYLDPFDNSLIEVESGREAQIRLMGTRLWKNPRVRLGDQWHDTIEVLPDMEGIIATFRCVQPIQAPDKARVHLTRDPLIAVPHNGTVDLEMYEKVRKLAESSNNSQGGRHEIMRQAQVWTSEGFTSQTSVKVRAFRPSFVKHSAFEQPCWAEEKDHKEKPTVPTGEENTERNPAETVSQTAGMAQ